MGAGRPEHVELVVASGGDANEPLAGDSRCGLPGEILDAAKDSEANGKVLSAALVLTHGGDPFYELDLRVGSLTMLMKIAGFA